MKKLKLSLAELKVESFETSSDNQKDIGTVKGYAPPWTDTNCYDCGDTNIPCSQDTCEPSCPYTCNCPQETHVCDTIAGCGTLPDGTCDFSCLPTCRTGVCNCN